MMCSYVDKLQAQLKEELVKRSDLMIDIVDLKNRIERLESFMESIGACSECCHDPCRCEKHVVIPD